MTLTEATSLTIPTQQTPYAAPKSELTIREGQERTKTRPPLGLTIKYLTARLQGMGGIAKKMPAKSTNSRR